MLLADVDAQNNVMAPHPLAAALFDLALDRPELFNAVLHQVRGHPRLLADLVLHPRTAALACLLIAQWRPPGAIEDDLNAFVQHLLAARVQFLGWSVNDQSKGGYSANANAGERDIILTSGSTILAIIEALNCKRALTQDVVRADLESHFQKLLGYGNLRIFFHLTYAYIDAGEVLAFLETAAEAACPSGFKHLGQDKIPHEDSRPPGFVARYDADFGEVKVVFLVLNMGQHRQRDAGITAGQTKARKAPKGAKKGKAVKSS